MSDEHEVRHAEIAGWLAARLDEDERVARDALVAGLDEGWPFWRDVDGEWEDLAATAWRERFGPTGLLREVEVKRRRLAQHAPAPDHGRFSEAGDCSIPDCDCATRSQVCAACRNYAGDPTEWPCEDVVNDAQAWADRADLPDELKLTEVPRW